MPKRSLIDQLDRAITVLLAGPEVKPESGDPELMPLLRVAVQLRQLPPENFKMRLKNDLQRSTSMTTMTEPTTAVRTVASPRLCFKSAAKAIDFYKKAFGAKETFRFETELGLGHAEMMIGDSVIMFSEEWPEGGRFSAETWGHSPITMEVNVPDVDAFVEHAVATGAKLVRPVTDQFYGNLPFGWWRWWAACRGSPGRFDVDDRWRRAGTGMAGRVESRGVSRLCS